MAKTTASSSPSSTSKRGTAKGAKVHKQNRSSSATPDRQQRRKPSLSSTPARPARGGVVHFRAKALPVAPAWFRMPIVLMPRIAAYLGPLDAAEFLAASSTTSSAAESDLAWSWLWKEMGAELVPTLPGYSARRTMLVTWLKNRGMPVKKAAGHVLTWTRTSSTFELPEAIAALMSAGSLLSYSAMGLVPTAKAAQLVRMIMEKDFDFKVQRVLRFTHEGDHDDSESDSSTHIILPGTYAEGYGVARLKLNVTVKYHNRIRKVQKSPDLTFGFNLRLESTSEVDGGSHSGWVRGNFFDYHNPSLPKTITWSWEEGDAVDEDENAERAQQPGEVPFDVETGETFPDGTMDLGFMAICPTPLHAAFVLELIVASGPVDLSPGSHSYTPWRMKSVIHAVHGRVDDGAELAPNIVRALH